MKITFLTIHPDFVRSYLGFGAFRFATAAGSLTCDVVNLRDYALDKRGGIDDRPYGGGDGMIMRPEPLAAAVEALGDDVHVISMSPAGKPWTQSDVQRVIALQKPVVFVCGRFGGIDQRFIDTYVDEEVSVGDFVVSGGELPAMLVADSLVRHLPAALGHEDSATHDSFSSVLEGRLEAPAYTRPPVFAGLAVPEELTSGDHARIDAWRDEKSWKLTRERRPDLLKS